MPMTAVKLISRLNWGLYPNSLNLASESGRDFIFDEAALSNLLEELSSLFISKGMLEEISEIDVVDLG